MKQQRYQYMNKEQITASFDIKPCTYFKVRKLIRLHPDRYTDYAIHDRLTDGNAFVDAKKYAKQLKNGDPREKWYKPGCLKCRTESPFHYAR